MSFQSNDDLSPMNHHILAFNLSSSATMTGADMDRHIDSALEGFGIGWTGEAGPCLPYGQCNTDIDNQGCGSYRSTIL